LRLHSGRKISIELSKYVNLSVTAVTGGIKRLEDSGIDEGNFSF